MSRTKTYDDTRESIFFDRMLLISKFKRLGIEDIITEILESHEIMEYYEVHLVERVRKWSNAFMTKSARDYFNQAISRENCLLLRLFFQVHQIYLQVPNEVLPNQCRQ